MPDKKDIITISIDKELAEHIDNYRYDNRIPSRSETIRRLLEMALKNIEKKSK